ncbi:MAG TPA: hypothetical protein DDX91_04635 [Ruminococcaceae bacterium]|nr:hypothetical protein [Oscillospiraceae bacterium]
MPKIIYNQNPMSPALCCKQKVGRAVEKQTALKVFRQAVRGLCSEFFINSEHKPLAELFALSIFRKAR